MVRIGVKNRQGGRLRAGISGDGKEETASRDNFGGSAEGKWQIADRIWQCVGRHGKSRRECMEWWGGKNLGGGRRGATGDCR